MVSLINEREEIYLEYKDKVTCYISGKISNSSFDEKKASLSTWIYTITRNTLPDYFRTFKQPYELPETLASDDEIDENLLREETLNSLAEALSVLEQRERDLIILHYYSGNTLKGIAEMMQMSFSNVKLIHNRALAKLRELMNAQAG